jgi:hypothetical protein
MREIVFTSTSGGLVKWTADVDLRVIGIGSVTGDGTFSTDAHSTFAQLTAGSGGDVSQQKLLLTTSGGLWNGGPDLGVGESIVFAPVASGAIAYLIVEP